jgi:hypothetical protein
VRASLEEFVERGQAAQAAADKEIRKHAAKERIRIAIGHLEIAQRQVALAAAELSSVVGARYGSVALVADDVHAERLRVQHLLALELELDHTPPGGVA